jgi:hypothetical protein
MNLGFETQEKDGMLIPKVNIQDFDIQFDEGNFNFNFDCSMCPGDLANIILNLFKGALLDKIRDEARGVVNDKVVGTVNDALMEGYPLTKELNEEIGIGLATMGPVVVKQDYLSAPIDGTIFLNSEGYNRPFDAPEIPVESAENPGEILLFISEYVFNTLSKTLNQVPIQFESSIFGFNLNIQVDGAKYPIDVSTHDKALHLGGGATVTIPALNIIFEVAAKSEIDLNFMPGDSANMLFIDPNADKDSLKIDTFILTVFGMRLNLSLFAGIVNFFIGMAIDHLVLPTIGVPKVEAMPLTATSALVNFFDRYTEAGIAFNFGMDN